MVSLYIIIFLILVMGAFITLMKPNYDRYTYYIGISILTLFLMLRFGQGTDYPSYLCIYENANAVLDSGGSLQQYFNSSHTEIGWKCIMAFFSMLNLNFWWITMFVAAVTMLATHSAINTFCKEYKTVALVLVYPTIYLTYYFSGIRQGLALALFFGVFLKKLIDKKYVLYVLGVLLLATIHSVSLCYLIVPIILLFDKKVFALGSVLSVMFSIGMMFEPMRELLKSIAMAIGAGSRYFGAPSFSVASLAERCLMLGIMLFMYYQNRNQIDSDEKVVALLKIYITGFLIYICLASNQTLSSRMAIMFKMAEFLLVPMLLGNSKMIVRKGCMVFVCIVAAIMSYKNINSYIAQSDYYEEIKVWNYPYVTVFNKSDILLYRDEFIHEVYGLRESDYF